MKQSRSTGRQRATGRPAPHIVDGTPLQLLIQSRMREIGEREQGYPLSYQQVVDRGANRFSKPTVGLIITGKTRRLTPETITGLARALELDEDTIRTAIKQAEDTAWQLPSKVQKLSPTAWDELMQFADYLLQRQRRGQ